MRSNEQALPPFSGVQLPRCVWQGRRRGIGVLRNQLSGWQSTHTAVILSTAPWCLLYSLLITYIYANGNVPCPASSSAFVDLRFDPLDARPVRSTPVSPAPSCLLTPTAGLGGALTSANGASTTKTSSPAPSWYALCLIDELEC